jgi:nucleoid-associated protein YgaU
MALEKLVIQELDLNLKRTGAPVVAMYNPREFTVETSVQFQRTGMPGLQTPITQFVGGQTQTITLDLFFDTYETREDVRSYTRRVTSLLQINSEVHAPPVCEFSWGGGGSLDGGVRGIFKGVFDRVTQKFTMFLDSGIPVRATLSVSISEYKTLDEQLAGINFSSSDRTKHRVFKEGDSLWLWSYKEYSDPARWRVIADANKLENPRLVAPGTDLVLPPLDSPEA